MLSTALGTVYRVERAFCAVACSLMGLLVFLDVVHRTATRQRSTTASVVTLLVAWAVVALAFQTRGSFTRPQLRVLAAAVVVGAAAAALKLFVWALPNGLVWSQTLGLVLMLWLALVGASMAAHEHRHLSLDLGAKLWPKRALPVVHAIGNALTAAFCFTLVALSMLSLRSHYGDWIDTDGAGGDFTALALPRWMAFCVMPVSLSIMGLRFVLHARSSYAGRDADDDDAMRMLGLRTPAKVDPS